MKAAGITTRFQFTQGQCLFCHQGQKRQNNLRLFCSFFIILPLIWSLFCLILENRHYLITCECSCILCPNFEKFCPNNGQFLSVGDATAYPSSPCRMLVSADYRNDVCTWPTLEGANQFILTTTAVSSFARAQKMGNHTVASHNRW